MKTNRHSSGDSSPEWHHHRLNAYALAAAAAGVSALAIAQPAEGKTVYIKTHTRIPSGKSIPLDLNHDGVADFTFTNYSNTFEGSQQGFLFLKPALASNAAEGDTTYHRAYALKAGKRVGAAGPFIYAGYISMISANATHRCFGFWDNVKDRYLGVKFDIKDKTHFGWARLSASCNSTDNKINAILTGYAYETVANKAIITGKTQGPDVITLQGTSLSHLARGASAISASRQK